MTNSEKKLSWSKNAAPYTAFAPTFGGQTVSKVEKWGWDTLDNPGVFMMVSKTDLRCDASYQRQSRRGRIITIASKFSWLAFGALTVALRPSGDFFIMDGQHRYLAACLRDDISDLPCLVFELDNAALEALGFVKIATSRSAILTIEKLKAQYVAGDPTSVVVHELIAALGRHPATGSGGPTRFRAVARLRKMVLENETITRRLWPLVHELTLGGDVKDELLAGLFYIETRAPAGTSLLDLYWRDRLRKSGGAGIYSAIRRAVDFHNRGGDKFFAIGTLAAMHANISRRFMTISP